MHISQPRNLRPPNDADLEWIGEQQREFLEFRETQFLRDGRIFDPTLKMVAEVADES